MQIVPCVIGAATAIAMVAPAALAGEINSADGVAMSGYDAVAYFTQRQPVKGSVAHVADYKDARFLFASASNRDVFVAQPEKYAPQYGGYCAYGTAAGYKAPIDPAAFTIVDDRLYLNYNQSVQKGWREQTRAYIAKADANWPTVKTQE